MGLRVARFFLTCLALGCVVGAGCLFSADEENPQAKEQQNPASTIVSLTEPQNGSVVSDIVNITAAISNNPAITQVEFFLNNVKIPGSTIIIPPYTYAWNTTSISDSTICSIYARAKDTYANTFYSDTVTVMVVNGGGPSGDTTPPSVAVAYPQDHAVVSGTLTILANASDNVGVQFVEFFIDGVKPQGATEYNPPYEHLWDTRALPDQSTHNIVAKATDTSNNFSYSDTVQVTVDNSGGGAGGVVLNQDFTSRQILPVNNWWNLDISNAPVDPSSQNFINWIGIGRALHPDFGQPPYGIPFIGVPGTQPLLPVTFTSYGVESDVGAPGRPPGYPVPDEAHLLSNYIEGGVPGGGSSGDRHMLIIDRDNWFLFETYGTRWNASLLRWEASSGAVFNLATNDRRPEGWTSTDAAGLAVFPGLVKYDEAYDQEINHALRFTVRATNGYVWPASHAAGSNPSAPPLGARIRLKASTDISGYPPEVQKIFQAMKTYGLILADNGSDMFVQGTMDIRWDSSVLNPAFHSLTAGDFEVIELGWNPVGSN